MIGSAQTDDGREVEAQDDVQLIASEGLEEWLVGQEVSLVFGTPPAKLWLLGVDDDGRLAVFDRFVPRWHSRVVNTPMKAIDGLNVSRRVYVPTDDHFERTLNIFTNPGASPITATMGTSNNLGSDSNTKITGTSAGGTTAANGDSWVTTFQNWSGTTTSDPRLGHVLQNTGAKVPVTNVSFTNGSDKPTWGYTFTVDPGQTVIIANFAVADPTIAASQADSTRLAALPPTALECMSPVDKAELANFKLPSSGYRLVDAAGDVYAYGSSYQGSIGGKPLNKPIVGIAATADGKGYWLTGADGGIFALGDAQFQGSQGGQTLPAPITGIANGLRPGRDRQAAAARVPSRPVTGPVRRSMRSS